MIRYKQRWGLWRESEIEIFSTLKNNSSRYVHLLWKSNEFMVAQSSTVLIEFLVFLMTLSGSNLQPIKTFRDAFLLRRQTHNSWKIKQKLFTFHGPNVLILQKSEYLWKLVMVSTKLVSHSKLFALVYFLF